MFNVNEVKIFTPKELAKSNIKHKNFFAFCYMC